MTGVMTVFEALPKGTTIISTESRKSLVLTWDGDQTYTIYRVEGETWRQLERFFDSSGNHTGALLTWLLSSDGLEVR